MEAMKKQFGDHFKDTIVSNFTVRSGWSSIFGGDDTPAMNHTILRHGLVMNDGLAIGLQGDL